MSNYHEIAKLNGAENYLMWEVTVRSEMILADTFDIIKDKYIAPIKPKDPAVGSSTGKDPEETERLAKAEMLARIEYDKYESANEKALSAIQLTVKPHVYAQIKLITNAREAWKKLKELYGKNTEAMFEKAIRKLSQLNLKDYKDLPAYLSEFKECTTKLAEMGSHVPHKMQMVYYKIGLPQYLQDHMFTLSQYDVRNNREVDLDFITVELGNRIQSDRPSERASETAAGRGHSGNRGKGPRGVRGNARGRRC